MLLTTEQEMTLKLKPKDIIDDFKKSVNFKKRILL